MQEEQDIEKLTERVKRLEYLQRNARIAIIILVGYSIYDVISKDSGSDIVFAHKVKAKEFELVDGTGTVFSSWKTTEQEDSRVTAFVIQGNEGDQLHLSSERISFVEKGRTNPVESLVIDSNGVRKTAVENQVENQGE